MNDVTQHWFARTASFMITFITNNRDIGSAGPWTHTHLVAQKQLLSQHTPYCVCMYTYLVLRQAVSYMWVVINCRITFDSHANLHASENCMLIKPSPANANTLSQGSKHLCSIIYLCATRHANVYILRKTSK